MRNENLEIKRLKKALDYAIKKLKLYADEDECCRGIFLEPEKVVDEWIKEIRKIEKGEKL